MSERPSFDGDDALLSSRGVAREKGYFDRFYFNVHQGSRAPFLLIGAGAYPVEGVIDGYVIAVTDAQQINLRVSDEHADEERAERVGPLSWRMVEPMKRWALSLERNRSGIAFELEWTATTPFWTTEPFSLNDGRGRTARFDHGFQSGEHRGWIELDGLRHEVEGWSGQRDRSRGTRFITSRQGVHMWVQAQFDDCCVGFNLDLDRSNNPTLLDGAVMGRDGTLDPIIQAEHDLRFSDGLELLSGGFELRTEGGRDIRLTADVTATAGGYMAGGGYGDWHGKPRGRDVLEHERWRVRPGEVDQRSLATPLTDRLSSFVRRDEGGDPVTGAGIFEFAHSRSPAFRYAASKPGAGGA